MSMKEIAQGMESLLVKLAETQTELDELKNKVEHTQYTVVAPLTILARIRSARKEAYDPQTVAALTALELVAQGYTWEHALEQL